MGICVRPFALCVIVALLVTSGALGQGVLINEVFTGNPDLLEIVNFTGGVVSLTGWTVDASFSATVYPTYTFPTGTSLLPGEALVLIESTSGLPVTSPTPPAGTQILNTSISYGWVGSSSGSLVLVDSGGNVSDFVVFGTGLVTFPPSAAGAVFTNPIPRTNSGDAIYRSTSIDTDDGGDWINAVAGNETPGTLNPGQTPLAQDVVSVGFAPTSGVVVFDTLNGTFTISATVASIGVNGGATLTDPTSDTLIGGAIGITGNYFGNEQTLAGMIFTPTTLGLVTSDLADGLNWQNIFSATTYTGWELSGPYGARVVPRHEMSSGPTSSVLRSGSGSLAIDSLQSDLAIENFSLMFRLTLAGPQLISLAKDFSPAPNPAVETALGSDGNGAFQVGIIHTVGQELYNVFVINPTSMQGQGPVFGIDLGIFQIEQITLPLGIAPFHVTPDVNGNYGFISPVGIVPLGTTLDHLVLELNGSTFSAHGPNRVTF